MLLIINVSPISDLLNFYQKFAIVYFVDDPIISRSYAKCTLTTFKFSASRLIGIVLKRRNSGRDEAIVFAG
ncbi:hypothetical protein GCM10010967_49390 [Dyadobacter beijingensis]|uniref:Uncharacterized protein n=1 Tax=Dyadobacter beijingensis TaxID=365489 RepID=A0ABQ2IDI3_9BACT|nr:hypothetical protein GCM10010967_49390 [Dyadobacter beijingensis]